MSKSKFFYPYEQYPKLESPNCFLATLSCFISKHYMVNNLDLAHLEHEFYLFNNDDFGISDIRSNMSIQPNWDMSSTESVLSHRVVKNISSRYGYSVSRLKIVDFQDLESVLLSEDYHVMSVVDPFFIEESPYFNKYHSFSVCIINGKDFNNSTYSFIERKHQQSKISFDDFENNFNYFFENFGHLDVYIVNREDTDFHIDDINLSDDLSRIVENLNSSKPNHGLNAINNFTSQYKNLLINDIPFLVPWTERCFGERHANALFFRALLNKQHALASYFIEEVEEIIKCYEELADLWRTFEMFHSFSVSQGSVQILYRNIPILEEICIKESLVAKKMHDFQQKIKQQTTYK
ncbi:hypothetical protein [Vibrio sp. AND4]|uniref:hypothetical protein n=1 Tax=Vibrio sp. AND4 TaxID=314289 RepID=UPI00117FBBA5|nr:hypothetical protein [Vibrio sp. AND4]